MLLFHNRSCGIAPWHPPALIKAIVEALVSRWRMALATAVLVLICALLSVAAVAAAPATTRSTDPAAADVSLIAAWLTGSDTAASTFGRPFGDGSWLIKAKDAIFYTDVAGVTVPPGLRAVPYDFLKPRMDLIQGGHKVDPAVLITRSVAGEPKEKVWMGKIAVPRAKPGERYYYVELAIGNMAWYGMKIGLYEADGKMKVEILWSAMS